MYKQLINTLIITAISYNCAYANNDNEWQINKLIAPTFQELQSEVINQDVTLYFKISDSAMNQALNHQFERIEYMHFLEDMDECRR